MIGLGALFNFLLGNRLPTQRVKRKERISVLFTNLLIVVCHPFYWLEGVPFDPVAGVMFYRGGGNLAVLRATSV